MRAFTAVTAAIAAIVALLAMPSKGRGEDRPPVWKDGWIVNLPNQNSAGTASFAAGGLSPYGYSDFSVGRSLGLGRELGLDAMQATLGLRAADPLASNGVMPMFEARRYLGVGPRIGLEGEKRLPSSWAVDWKVGASLLKGDRGFDGSGATNSALPNFATGGSVLNVDGLLGLSYWFDTASKLTLGYRADYFKGSSSVNLSGSDGAERLNHGPVMRFTIQK